MKNNKKMSPFLPFHNMLKQWMNKLPLYVCRLPSVKIDSFAPSLDKSIELIEDHSCMPPLPELGLTHDDITPLLRIVKALQPKNILELGTAHGNTTANMCAVSDAHIYTVNALPEQISGHVTTVTLTKENIGCVYRKYGFDERITQIYENTLNLDCQKYFQGVFIDLAVIDACHDIEYVIHDFNKILPILRSGALVLLHDTHPSIKGHLKGSYMACMELRNRGFDIKHIEGTWWGVWRKDSD